MEIAKPKGVRRRLLGSGFIASIVFACLVVLSGYIYIVIESDKRVGREYELYEGVYWAVITATTIGYGDITPKTEGGKVFTVFYSLVSIPLFLYSITTLYKFVVTILHKPIIAILERMQTAHDPSVKRTIYSLGSKHFLVVFNLIAFLIILPVSALIYTKLMDNLSYSDALYFVWITQLTIGYGDISPNTKGSRIFSIFALLIMVVNLASLVSAIVDSFTTKVEKKKKELAGEDPNMSVLEPSEAVCTAAPNVEEFEKFYKSLDEKGQKHAVESLRSLVEGLEDLIKHTDTYNDDMEGQEEKEQGSIEVEDSSSVENSV